ncbi:hypothetical protein K2173_016360 [Erythroxylum novogranatense]|uniref:PPC domain-containing protein n=1 Tax=Erythroxylum novogranatense TaxID=1862640 RepID=A0AAV8SGB5_9ROSI|nr:hypothetical protein K2173_016360 [Erythroxylum novogranatense]
MADYGAAMSLSREPSHNTSDDSDDDLSPRSVPTLPSALASSSSSSKLKNRYITTITTQKSDDGHLRDQIQRKPRGRPPGSKNRPKPPIVITRDSESAMKPAILEISAGFDVIDSIIKFARRNRTGVSVISATGSVSNVTLRHPVSHAASLSLHGPFNLLALSGSFLGSLATNSLSSSSSASFYSSSSCFGISLAGAQGQLFGGIVAGKVTVASQVVVLVATFSNPTFHRLPFENDEVEETKPSVGGNSVVVGNNSSSNNTSMSMSVYGVAGNPSPINCQMSPPDIMHWGPRPPY